MSNPAEDWDLTPGMAVGEVLSQEAVKTMAWNSSKLPKLVVDLAKGCHPPSRMPGPGCQQHITPSGNLPSMEYHHKDYNEDSGVIRRVCNSACSCDLLYSSSSGSSQCSNNTAMDSGFSDEDCLSSECQTPSPIPLPVSLMGGGSIMVPSTPGSHEQSAFVRLLSPPPILCRTTSDSGSTSGCDSPVPKDFQVSGGSDSLRDFYPEDSSGSCESSSGSGGHFLHSGRTQFTSVNDLQILSQTESRLQDCGFYYPHMSMADAKKRLKGHAVGTFILRDSSHSGYLFTVSTKTVRGTTSVRIAYGDGHFRLDCDEALASHMPRFDCILSLIQYYILASKRRSSKCVWIESSGRKDTPVVLSKPLKQNVSSLKHLARRALHQCVPNDKLEQLPANSKTLQYLKEYPFYV